MWWVNVCMKYDDGKGKREETEHSHHLIIIVLSILIKK